MACTKWKIYCHWELANSVSGLFINFDGKHKHQQLLSATKCTLSTPVLEYIRYTYSDHLLRPSMFKTIFENNFQNIFFNPADYISEYLVLAILFSHIYFLLLWRCRFSEWNIWARLFVFWVVDRYLGRWFFTKNSMSDSLNVLVFNLLLLA